MTAHKGCHTLSYAPVLDLYLSNISLRACNALHSYRGGDCLQSKGWDCMANHFRCVCVHSNLHLVKRAPLVSNYSFHLSSVMFFVCVCVLVSCLNRIPWHHKNNGKRHIWVTFLHACGHNIYTLTKTDLSVKYEKLWFWIIIKMFSVIK